MKLWVNYWPNNKQVLCWSYIPRTGDGFKIELVPNVLPPLAASPSAFKLCCTLSLSSLSNSALRKTISRWKFITSLSSSSLVFADCSSIFLSPCAISPSSHRRRPCPSLLPLWLTLILVVIVMWLVEKQSNYRNVMLSNQYATRQYLVMVHKKWR